MNVSHVKVYCSVHDWGQLFSQFTKLSFDAFFSFKEGTNKQRYYFNSKKFLSNIPFIHAQN